MPSKTRSKLPCILNAFLLIYFILYPGSTGIPAKVKAADFTEFERTDLRTSTSKTFQTGPNSFRQEVDVVQDTFIDSGWPSGINDVKSTLYVGKYTDSDVCISGSCPANLSGSITLLKFGITLPITAIATSSTLKLFQTGGSSPTMAPIDITVSRITQDWSESAHWPAPPNEGSYGSAQISYYKAFSQSVIKEIQIPLSTALISQLKDNNNGFLLKPSGSLDTPGVKFCSREGSPNFCIDKHDPKLIINYVENHPPYTPSLVSPGNGTFVSGNCDESLTPVSGICRVKKEVTFRVSGVGDSDGNIQKTQVEFSGVDGNSTLDVTGEGDVMFFKALGQGTTTWRVRSMDDLGVWGEYSPTYSLVMDTIPPNVPVLPQLSEFTKGAGTGSAPQIEIEFPRVADTMSLPEQIGYIFEYNTSPNFGFGGFPADLQMGVTKFEIGPKGADGIAGNADDIVNGQKYYFRVKAWDGHGNKSNWSNVTSTTIDSEKPVLEEVKTSSPRFSPNNPTSVGVDDVFNLDASFTEKFPNQIKARIMSGGNLIREVSQDLSQNTSGNATLTWDGKDASGNFVNDGPYTVETVIRDKAGNENDNRRPQIIVVDNTDAKISISSPIDGYWTNKDNFEVTGQVKSPHQEGREDGDLSKLEIVKLETGDVKGISPNSLGIFSTLQELKDGENKFNLKSTDTVGNIFEKGLTINKDNVPPVISSVAPSSKINEKRPEIRFNIKDPTSITSKIPTGKNPKGFKLNLSYNKLENGVTKIVTKGLINDGVNLDPTFISDLNCSSVQDSATSISNGNVSSDELECSAKFLTDLSSTYYQVFIEASDNAGNKVSNGDASFQVDTAVFNEITAPVQNGLYSNSKVSFKGRGSKGGRLLIYNETLKVGMDFILNEALDGTGSDGADWFIRSNFKVQCGEFIDTDNNPSTQNEEVCSWEVKVRQAIDPDGTHRENIENLNKITITDDAGNSKSVDIKTYTNIYSFEVVVSSDLEYISPNGDGKQDSVVFTHQIKGIGGVEDQPDINFYWLSILNSKEEVTNNSIYGEGFLPENSFWDGKECISIDDKCTYVWPKDGDYSYYLTVHTKDGIAIESPPKPLYIRTKLDKNVVITSPKNDFITSKGVINIQGQGPSNNENSFQDSKVFICAKLFDKQNQSDCVTSTYSSLDANGYFSSLITLPNEDLINTQRYVISAYAFDNFGNRTPDSNTVQIIHDATDSIKKVSITPSLTGITSEADYQKFLNGELSIDKIRSVGLNVDVTQNTEQLEFSFTDKNNIVNENRKDLYRLIGTINNSSEQNKNLNPYQINDIKHLNPLPLGSPEINSSPCNTAIGCNWKTLLPINKDYSGIYEIRFRTKKGENIEESYAGFKVDGTLPAAPNIMVVEKWDDSGKQWIKLESIGSKFYTNTSKIRIRGAAEPGVSLEPVIGSSKGNIFTPTAQGIWESEYDLNEFLNKAGCERISEGKCASGAIKLGLVAFEGDQNNRINEVASSNNIDIIYDTIAPHATNIHRSTPTGGPEGWVRTGDLAVFNVEADEGLSYSDLVKEDNFIRTLQDQYFCPEKSAACVDWSGSITVSKEAEGYYSPTIRLTDYAGNKSVYDAHDWEKYGFGDWRLYIDNTPPDESKVDTRGWGENGGHNADGILPEKGRLNPEYVIKSDHLTISGQSEQGQKVEIWANNKLINTVVPGSEGCKSSGNGKISVDGLVTRSANICNWSFEYKFPGKGENNKFGVPLESYIFSTRVKDKAGNLSPFSEQKIVYNDTQAPSSPKITSISPTKTPAEPLMTNRPSVDIYTLGERFSDTEIWSDQAPSQRLSGAQLSRGYTFGYSDNLGRSTLSVNLGSLSDSSKPGCIAIIDGKRTGICGDGEYRIRARSTDAAGNSSNFTEVSLIRDTVAPAKPSIPEPSLCDDYICLSINGEISSEILFGNDSVEKLDSNNKVIKVAQNWQYNKEYSFDIRLEDKAGNISEPAKILFKTPEPSLFQGAVPGANKDDPYAKKISIEEPTVDIFMEYGTDRYSLQNFNIPVPSLTMISTGPDNKADAYGVALSSLNKLNANITVRYMTYNQAKKYCNAGIVVSGEEKACMERAMGIDSLLDWMFEVQKDCLFVIPIITMNCVLKAQDTKFDTLNEGIHKFDIGINPKVTLYNDSSGDSNISEITDTSLDGHFAQTLSIPEMVRYGDWTHAKTYIAGNIEYKGLTIPYSGESSWSNKLQVDNAEYVNVKGRQAKVLPVPYFNQYLEPDGKLAPPGGWYMCGAASSVMVAGYFGKLPYDKSDEHSLKKYMYSDSGQGINSPCPKLSGAFAMTSYRCEESSWAIGIINYLKFYNLNFQFIAKRNSLTGGNEGNLTIAKVKSAIDKGNPLIVGYQKGEFGHIFVIKGYTVDGKIIVNDSYKDFQNNKQSGYNYSGKGAIYDLDELNNAYITSVLEVSK